jgi:TP901 family phage tail tape measure protein
MAKLAIALEIGGAVAASLGAAFGTAKGHIKKLEDQSNRTKLLKGTIGETIKLREEWKKAHDSGSAAASGLLRRLESNLDVLKKQGVEVGRLAREYQRLGREAKAADLQQRGRQQIDAGKSLLKPTIAATAVGVGLAAIPTKVSADYQAIIRDIAIKADVANQPEEGQLTRTVIDTAKDTGMSRNDVADLVNQLVGAGMELDKALAYAPTAAKFAVGQGASGVDTASMIMALQQNAKINDPEVMKQALEAIAYQGQAGSFEASDMARWFPQLLAGMEKTGSTGLGAVTSLGSMLQVQMKTAGSSDEAANNFKNWIEKIGSGDVVKAYKDAGIDYQASLNTGIQKGMSTLESSMALALRYVEATDPAKAQKIKDAQAGISKEADPVKAKAALDALEKSLRTGDLFADMQVKAALTAYSQNRELYTQLKNDSTNATGILDKNLAERRETSAQIWKETLQAVDESMRSVGDAIRPVTDKVAQGLTFVVRKLTELSDKAPEVVMGIAGIATAIGALITAYSTAKIGKGIYNVARGKRLGRATAGGDLPATGNKAVDASLGALGKVLGAGAANDPAGALSNEPQRVFVVNARELGGGLGDGGGDDGGRRRRRRGRGGRRARVPVSTRRPPIAKAPKVGKLTAVAKVPEIGKLGAVAKVAQVAEGGVLSKAVGLASKTGVLAKRLPGGNVLDAGFQVYNTAMTAETQNEKAEGYGRAAGGLAGSMAGSSVGAAIGSVVPIVGTAIGGLIGAVLGGMGGEELGGFLGLKIFGEDEPAAKADKADKASPGDVARAIAEAAPPPTAPVVAQALEQAKPKGEAPKIDQSFAFSPTNSYTIQGDVKDPAQLARDLEPYQKAQFEAWWREMSSRQSSAQLYDEAHV